MGEITKKAFQKAIKGIREDRNAMLERKSDFPKPMMTKKQMEKLEATVNCGGEWGSAESTKAIADMVMADERFKTFLNDFRAEAKLELNNFNTYQIRITFLN